MDVTVATAATISRNRPGTMPHLDKAKGRERTPAPSVALHRLATAPGLEPDRSRERSGLEQAAMRRRDAQQQRQQRRRQQRGRHRLLVLLLSVLPHEPFARPSLAPLSSQLSIDRPSALPPPALTDISTDRSSQSPLLVRTLPPPPRKLDMGDGIFQSLKSGSLIVLPVVPQCLLVPVIGSAASLASSERRKRGKEREEEERGLGACRGE